VCFSLCNLIDRYIICSHGCCSKPVKLLLPLCCVCKDIFSKPNDLRNMLQRFERGCWSTAIQTPTFLLIHSFILLVLVLVLLEVLTDGLHSKSWGSVFLSAISCAASMLCVQRIYSTSQMIWGTCCRGLREVVGPLQSKLQPFYFEILPPISSSSSSLSCFSSEAHSTTLDEFST